MSAQTAPAAPACPDRSLPAAAAPLDGGELEIMAQQPIRRRAFYGTLVHSLSLTEIEYVHDALLGVDEAGRIAFVERSVQAEQVEERLDAHGWTAGDVQRIELTGDEFLMPG